MPALNSLLLVTLAAIGADPAYRLETREVKRVQCMLTYDISCDSVDAAEWIVFVPALPETGGQTKVSSQMTPTAKLTNDLSDLSRPLLSLRQRASGADLKHALSLQVTYEATLHSRKLAPVGQFLKGPRVAPLSAKAREAALGSADQLDYKSPDFQDWLRDSGLAKKSTESEIEFARRVFQFIRTNFDYEFQPGSDRQAVSVCGTGKSDCGGLSNLFVATLRSQGIPARALVGRWAESAKPGVKLNGHAYFQWHVKAEFFAANVGWVPVDLSSAILHDRSTEGLYYFGYDPGDFVTQHIDGDLVVDSIHFGKHTLTSLQQPAFWVTGKGTLDNVKTEEGWTVKENP
jgi:transglutaminase-like putative cysteine protease